MSTKTQTTTTHYHIQKKRRAEFMDEWRRYRQTVIRKEDVTLTPTARGLRTGVYMGWDGDRPTRQLDALVRDVVAVQCDSSMLGRFESDHHVKRRGLSGSVRAK